MLLVQGSTQQSGIVLGVREPLPTLTLAFFAPTAIPSPIQSARRGCWMRCAAILAELTMANRGPLRVVAGSRRWR